MDYILVTGAAGFIGSHLCERLISLGFGVVGVDCFDPFYSRTLKEDNLKSLINHSNFKLLDLNLLNDDLEFTLNGYCFTQIVHLAAKVGVRPSIVEPQEYINHNISATLKVLEYARKKNIKKFLFASSSSIYGNNVNTPWNETLDVGQPISPYAFSKRSCELLNYSYHHLYKIDIINLRFFTVYGPRQRPDLAISKFFNSIKNNKPITVFGDGTTKRDYTYISDIIDGIILSIDFLANHHDVYEIINLGNGNPIMMRDFISNLIEGFGEGVKVENQEEQMGDVTHTSADISKARKLLGFEPKVDFPSGLKLFAESLK